MIRLFKTVLLCLLMALLPLGGMASASASCRPAHDACAGAHDSCGEAADHGHAKRHPSSSDKSFNSHGEAGCGMCLAGTAAPPASVAAFLPAGSEAVAPAYASAYADYVPPGIDRPPR